MKKLTRKMKSIIIACVAIVCVAAITVGCVLGFAKKPSDGPSKHELFLAAQQKFENAINANVNDAEYSTIDFTRVNSLVGDNEILEITKDYVVFENAQENQDMYVLNSDASKKITDPALGFVKAGSGFSKYEVLKIAGDRALMVSKGTSGDFVSIVDFSNFNNPVSNFSLETSTLGDYSYAYQFILEDDYFAYFAVNQEMKVKLYVNTYSAEKKSQAGVSVECDNILNFRPTPYENALLITKENSVELFYISDGKIKTFEKDFVLNQQQTSVLTEYAVTQINANNFLVSKIDNIDVNDKTANSVYELEGSIGVYKNYSYSLFNTSTGKESKFNLDEGYSYVYVNKNLSVNGYAYLVQQKLDDNEIIDDGSSLIRYYDDDMNVIVEYNGFKEMNIVYADDLHFVTNSKILKVSKNSKASVVKEFGDDKEFVLFDSSTIDSKYFSVRSTRESANFLGVMDIYGNLVFDVNDYQFDEMFAVKDGYAIAKNHTNVYLINSKTKDVSPLNNSTVNVDLVNNINSNTLSKGYDVYSEEVTKDGKVVNVLKTFAGEVVCEYDDVEIEIVEPY
ncbi:MAG: hypothetical protein J6A51_01765, partial [Clostridia bacterium]|nr:hypothetical protein [Clostridia bacterium]